LISPTVTGSEDTLVAYATEQTRRANLAEALSQNQRSLALARQQYEHGLVSFLNVLDPSEMFFPRRIHWRNRIMKLSPIWLCYINHWRRMEGCFFCYFEK
jgi:hypothetical protein